MDNLLKILIHFLGFSNSGIGLVYDILYIDFGTGLGYQCLLTYCGYGGKFKYLTFWCQVGQPGRVQPRYKPSHAGLFSILRLLCKVWGFPL